MQDEYQRVYPMMHPEVLHSAQEHSEQLQNKENTTGQPLIDVSDDEMGWKYQIIFNGWRDEIYLFEDKVTIGRSAFRLPPGMIGNDPVNLMRIVSWQKIDNPS